MPQSLTIGADPAMRLVFSSPTYRGDGHLTSYRVELLALDMRAGVRLDNPDLGQPPTVLFDTVAQSWQGWHGVKRWQSLEGELEIDATCDRTGHIELAVRIPEHASNLLWSVNARILIEAGQAEAVAREVQAFFAEQA